MRYYKIGKKRFSVEVRESWTEVIEECNGEFHSWVYDGECHEEEALRDILANAEITVEEWER